jgi:hypothetical protein
MSFTPSSTQPTIIPHVVLLSRRELLQTAALLALSAEGCAPFAKNVRLAVVASGGLDERELAHVLRALISALLAYDHPDFAPGTQATVAQKLLAYFPINSDPLLTPLIPALAIFERMDLFSTLPPPMRAAERKLLLAEGLSESALDAALAEREAEDLRAYEQQHRAGLGKRFSEADLAMARAYLSLWGDSAFLMRRRIYRAVRSMVLVAAYSLPTHWPAIGYAGPLLGVSGIRGT